MSSPVASKTLADWLDYYGDQHVSALGFGTDNIATLWRQLGAPALGRRIITVAGTNGKGSTCRLLTQLLGSQGYRVGTFISPHLRFFNERILLNGQMVDDASIAAAFTQVEASRGEIPISFFEATALAAFLIFANQPQTLDFVVLEVGLGGRFDATNIIDADLAIITSISLDHANYFGHDLEQIALEKAGVFRPHRPAIYAEYPVRQSVKHYCAEQDIPLLEYEQDYTISTADSDPALRLISAHLKEKAQPTEAQQNEAYCQQSEVNFHFPGNISSLGMHQLQNAAATLIALIELEAIKDRNVIEQALARFALPGRMQTLIKHHPAEATVLVDVAHNAASATVLADYLRREHQGKRIHGVIGMLADKDHLAILQPFADLLDDYYFADLTGLRGFTGQALAEKWQQALLHNADTLGKLPQIKAFTFNSVENAYQAAQTAAVDGDLIVVFGSFHTVAEAIDAHNNLAVIHQLNG